MQGFVLMTVFQNRFLWIYKEVDLAPYPVISLVLKVGDTEKFPHALGFESLDPFFFPFQTRELSKLRERMTR